MKLSFRPLTLISSLLSVLITAGCTDGIWSLRGYIPEKVHNDEVLTPPPPPPPPQLDEQKVPPGFILRAIDNDDFGIPEKLPPRVEPPKKPEPNPLDAS